MPTNERKAVQKFYGELAAALFYGVAIIALILILSRNPDAYGAGGIIKLNRLETMSHPAIIFTGGSGLAFGVDTEKIGTAIRLAPVNLGLYAGFGIDYLLNEAGFRARSGDTVVIVPEYDVLAGDTNANGFLVLEAMQADPHLGKFALSNPATLISIVREFPGWFGTRIYSMIGRYVVPLFVKREETLYQIVFRAANFNEYGDMTGHLTSSYRAPRDVFLGAEVVSHLNPEVLARMKTFIAEEGARGVHVYISWPAVPRTLYSENSAQFELLDASLTAALGKNTFLGSQTDFVFEDGEFFDTINHLAAPARAMRTAKLISLLKEKGY